MKTQTSEIIMQILTFAEALRASQGLFPPFVAEGTGAEKLERVRHNDYLAKACRSFSRASKMVNVRSCKNPLEVSYFNTATAKPWGG